MDRFSKFFRFNISLVVLGVIWLILYCVSPRLNVNCVSGTCTFTEGSKQVAKFKTEDISECTVGTNRHRGRRHTRTTYYPKLVLKNGQVLVLSGFSDSRRRTNAQNFCENIFKDKYFKYSVK